MRFEKYQALGNDFIIVPADALDPLDTTQVRALCDRHFGIGADGVLLIGPGEKHPWRMQVINADGSPAAMCGNGLRCVVRYLRAHDPAGLPADFVIETGAGPLPVHDDGDNVAVEMGLCTDHGRQLIQLGGHTLQGRQLSLGNPHLVLFGKWSDADFNALGPALQTHAAFPGGINVSFAT
ncbi:MAG: diaminopimelate epimerase, partial [Burkholderiaceae bacterium]|nr:diaminopimelate epimerase [Burkholderiaceae bacterium]